MDTPPYSEIEAVTEILHGVPVTDPYRWLEDQESPRTRDWISAQMRYARSYLDSISGREQIRGRIYELLDVETYDSLHKIGNRYFFRKRLPGQEQPCIWVREGRDGPDELLVDPAQRGTGSYTAVKPLHVSPDGRLLLYEVKQGGERSGSFELFNVKTRETLPDRLPRGYLRGFAFSPDSNAFYYGHEASESDSPHYRAAYRHIIGTDFAEDIQVFFAGEDERIRLRIISGAQQLGFLVIRFAEKTATDFYLWPFESANPPEPVIKDAEYRFGPLLLKNGRMLAITDLAAPNFRIVEVCRNRALAPDFRDIVPDYDTPIQDWAVIGDRIFVSYFRQLRTEVDIFDFSGKRFAQVPVDATDTIRFLSNVENGDDLFFERESFTKPIEICSFSLARSEVSVWASRRVPFDSCRFDRVQVWFRSKDGTEIPMYLVGRREVLDCGPHPAIMTSYGGYGVAMTPQFSVFVAFLLERGCIFALPNIRGGSEFGVEWHEAAKRRKRQVAFDDFVAAAEWLVETGHTEPRRLAIFGGSNSGLLVAAATTQRPDLFRAVLCMVPMVDMLRYHLFDNAHVWKDEFGTADDPEDFAALLSYSPYHKIRDGSEYPATMIVSGDADQNCNPLHARKMTARLQAANVSENPIFLDYSQHRGHSPVLPLRERIAALTDRMAFLCDRLGLSV
jgi:prolyl oligopeptidase